MKKITLILSLLVVAIASAFAQTEYTLDMAGGQVTNQDGSRGSGYTLSATENSNLVFNLSMQDYLISKVNDCIKIVTDGDNVYKDITIAAPEGYSITACSISYVSTRGTATASVYLGSNGSSTKSTSTPATVNGDYSNNPAKSIMLTMISDNGYQGFTIKEFKITVKSDQVEGGDNEGEGEGGEVEGGDNEGEGEGGEVEGGDNGDNNEGGEVEGGDNGDNNEGGDNGDGNEGEGDNNEGGDNEGDNNEGDNNEEGEDTSINDVEVETSQTIYDLTGRRVNEITKAGIYIINGKKVLVK